MSTTKRSVNKQEATNNAPATIEETNNTTANVTTAEQAQPEQAQPDTLCTIGVQDIHTGDTFRLKADPQTESATIEVNPSDNSRNPDKPNNWNAATREAYRVIMKACIGLKVTFTFTSDRRTTITETATITGCGMDSNNDRATFTLSTGRKVASGYTFKVLGYDPDHRTNRNTDTTDANDTRTAADIRADIAATEAKREKLTARLDHLRQALTKAIETDLNAIREALTAHPTNRRTLAAVIATPTANRIPAEEAEGLLAALKAVESIPAAAAAVRVTMEAAHGEHAVYLMGCNPAAIAAADEVAAVMKAHQLQLGDIPTDILPD